MAGLSPEEIKKLLTIPQAKKRAKKDVVDTNDRTYQIWFKLSPKGYGESLEVRPQCSNPECLDTRPPIKTAMGEMVKVQFTIVLPGSEIRTCRRCFMDGYGLVDEAQAQLTAGS